MFDPIKKHVIFYSIFMTQVAAISNINLIGSSLSSEDTAPAKVFTFISLYLFRETHLYTVTCNFKNGNNSKVSFDVLKNNIMISRGRVK